MTRFGLSVAIAALLIAPAGMAQKLMAQELKVGLSAEPSAMDPHFHNLAPNNSMTKHIFDRIVDQDENQIVRPMLASVVEDARRDHLGIQAAPGREILATARISPRTTSSTPIAASPKVENSPSSMAINVRAITAMTAPDPLDPADQDREPAPAAAERDLRRSASSPPRRTARARSRSTGRSARALGTFPKTEAFNAGQAAIGTGPYKLSRFTKGDRVILERNESYWGEKPAWQRIIFRPITSAGPRVAALLSGDVDLIENVPIQDLARIKQNADFKVVQGLSNRVIYLHFNYLDDAPPGVDAGGKNPFRDKRVRAAISKAIDRDAIVARIMGGVAVPAGELLPNVMFGANKDMAAPEAGRRGRQEAARRGRLSERLYAGAGDAERPLHQRRADFAGGGADADAASALKCRSTP